MLCPHCHAELSDDAAICSYCDAILDSSFLDAGEPTAPRADSVAAPPLETNPGVDVEPQPGLGGNPIGGAADGTSILRMDPEQHRETRIVAFSDIKQKRNPSLQRAKAAGIGNAAQEESVLDDFWGQILLAHRRLRPLDKAALACIVTLLIGAFLPWFHARGKGSVAGIEGSGAITALLAGLAVVAFWVRVSLRMVLLVLVQVGLIAGAALFAGHALLNPGTSTPSFGIYITVLAGLAAAVISLAAVVKS
ncbi:MAG: hypothetical protein ABI333_00965 [bacterium]